VAAAAVTTAAVPAAAAVAAAAGPAGQGGTDPGSEQQAEHANRRYQKPMSEHDCTST
jgi:hypothetical protein